MLYSPTPGVTLNRNALDSLDTLHTVHGSRVACFTRHTVHGSFALRVALRVASYTVHGRRFMGDGSRFMGDAYGGSHAPPPII